MAKHEKPLSPEQLRALKDEDIDFSDIPETDEAFWRSAELAGAGRAKRTALRLRRAALGFLRESKKN